MQDHTSDPKHETADEGIRFPYPFTGQADSEVRVHRAAMVQAEVWVKARIEGWFEDHNKPEPGTSIRVPDYQFEPKLLQPSR